MTAVPEYAIQCVGRHRVRAADAVYGGFANNVWRLRLAGGDTVFVKRLTDRRSFDNEVHANELLVAAGLPAPSLHLRGAMLLLYRSTGAGIATNLTERLVRQTGFELRRLHALGSCDDATNDQSVERPTLIERIASRVPEHVGDRAIWCMTHGGVSPENVVVSHFGEFGHFVDFEDFSPGDPLIDVIVACLSFATFCPANADDGVRFLLRGYADGCECSAFRERWSDRRGRSALAEAAMDEMIAEARSRARDERLARYLDGRGDALNAVAAAVV